MKLTAAQIATVRFALEQYAEKYESRAETVSDGSFWQEQVATARELEAAFNKALSVEIESAQLTPATSADQAQPLHLCHQETAIPTALPSPSPRALRLASTLSIRSLKILALSHRGPSVALDSRCNTILRSRGETEPLASLDLLAAARLEYQKRGYKQSLPLLSQALAGCPESPAAPHAAPVGSAAPAPHPTSVSSLQQSSANPGESCSDINCDGQCLPARQPHTPPLLQAA